MTQEIELTGVVRGQRVIELDDAVALPEDVHVRVRLVPEAASAEEHHEDAEAEAILRTIQGLRHTGRSVVKP